MLMAVADYPSARIPRDWPENDAYVFTTLKRLEQCCDRLRIPSPRTKRVCERIEQWGFEVQSVAFVITEAVLAQSNVLSILKDFLDNTHLNFQNARRLHPHLVEDLTYLMRKWGRSNLDNDPTRGLIRKQRQNGSTFWIADKNWEHFQPADNFGDNGLVTGQRWFCRADLRRDGGHGPIEAGISGTMKGGAYSIIMGRHDDVKREYYSDRDYAENNGEVIRYNGTAKRVRDRDFDDDEELDIEEEGDDKKYSVHTRMLLESIKTGKPVRVIRSEKLPHINELRPAQGYRFDGMYVVEGYEVIEEERGILGFILRRVSGQPPVRKHDQRTFEETPEQAARQKETARRLRASLNEARSASLND